MDTISMTSFVDFVVASGTPKMTAVSRAKKQHEQGYHPSRDYWKLLRDGLIDAYASDLGLSHVDDLIAKAPSKKVANYKQCLSEYKRWVGRKKFEWIGTKSQQWEAPVGLVVRVNPELGLRTSDGDMSIKLYFKADPISKNKIETILYLLEAVDDSGRIPAVLDVPRGKLYQPTSSNVKNLGLLVEAEAASFWHLWNSL